MTNLSTSKPPVWFWIVSVLELIWNGMGVNAYLQQAYDTEAHRALYTAEQLDVISQQPAWYTTAFAIAVFCGALGCIALLLRKRFAKLLFICSFIAVLVQMYYNLIQNSNLKDAGAFEWSMQIAIPVICILMILLSNKGIAKGWLK